MAKSRKNRPADPVAAGGSPSTERGFILSGAVLGIGVLCGTLAVFTASSSGSDDDANTAAVEPTLAASLPPAAPCPEPRAPAPEAANGQSPADVAWTSYRGVFLPVSGTSGPLAAQGDVARCFAHSQTGALMAAVQISVRYAFAPNWREVGHYQIVADPARDAALQRRADTAPAGGNSGQPLPDPQRVRQVEGYQIVSYADTAATIRILAATPSGGTLVSSTYAMVWVDGDWKLQMQTTGSTSVSIQEVDSPAGFTVWSESAVRP